MCLTPPRHPPGVPGPLESLDNPDPIPTHLLMLMNILVTGGAGYIGSHAVKRLCDGGHHVVVIDNLFRGHRAAIPTQVPFYPIDLRTAQGLTNVLESHRIEAVMHFAGLAYVGESVDQPLNYFQNNTVGSINLLAAMAQVGVRRLVFSSTCTTYGIPKSVPIVETEVQRPINPYGWSKLFVERILSDHAQTDDQFSYAALRYFNVAGAAQDGAIGEDHNPETHLIPVLLQTAMGHRDFATIFGNDYDTADGTCIRDYIHVEDLVDAHATVLESLASGKRRAYNLGTGQGTSVMQVIESVRRVTGLKLPVKVGERRPGDPPILYANAAKIHDELGWQARINDLDEMVQSAWSWFQTHPLGYEKQN